jgi:hypothetical protein
MVKIKDIKNLKLKIRNKLNDYKKRDKIKIYEYPDENIGLVTLNTDDIIEMVKNHNGICEGCNCELIFENYAPFCIYQFSMDRIDNNKIHDKNNLRIVCYNCNALGDGAKKQKCSRNCHI